MASQISVQKVVAANSWLVRGAEATTSVILLNDTDVHFTDGTVTTLPANTEAVVVGGGTTFNRTNDVYVLFLYQGDPTLRAEKESLLYLLSADYCPLGRVLHDHVVPYQPVPFGGGATIKTGSWSGGAILHTDRSGAGGAFYGVFDAQSAAGGAYSVSSISPHPAFKMGLFFKVPNLPSSAVTLIDMNGAAGGYIRAELGTDGSVSYKAIISGNAVVFNMTTSNGATSLNPVTPGAFHWVCVGLSYNASSGHSYVSGAVWDGSGVVLGGWNSSELGFGSGSPSCTFSVGIPGSGSGNLPFPIDPGWAWSKPFLKLGAANTPNNVVGPPSVDWIAPAVLAGYNCRQTVGTALVLNDVTGIYNMSPGAQGLKILAAGPFG